MIYLPEKNMFIGDRIATWMFYMSDVGEGGRTVFPRIGAGVRPEAGSAVFWYNILDNGQADRLTLHGACPVLFGTKWGKEETVQTIVNDFHKTHFSCQQMDTGRRANFYQRMSKDCIIATMM